MELPDGNGGRNCQYVVVMRHGDRLDNVDPAWPASAERPWDPPLHPDGMDRAFAVGGRIREDLGSPIHRVFVSPFLRCLQTASEAVRGLCTVANSAGDSGSVSSEAAAVDLSKIKVSVEMGLSEMLNTRAIRPNVAPKDGDFKFDLAQCESQLPTGTIHQNAEKIYKKLPDWEEPVLAARARYVDVAKALADKYPSENLLLVTHGEGVGSVFSAAMKGASVYEVDYCGFTILRRDIDFGQGKPLIAGELTNHSDSGIKFLAPSASHA